MAEKNMHALYAIEQDFLEDGYRARCTCGWLSDRKPKQSEACDALTEHKRLATED